MELLNGTDRFVVACEGVDEPLNSLAVLLILRFLVLPHVNVALACCR